jgi:hypothetical protein
MLLLVYPVQDSWTVHSPSVVPDMSLRHFATNHLLNYDSSDVITAFQLMKDRNNPTRFQALVPAGLSQVSCLPGEEENESDNLDEWNYPLEEMSDAEDYKDSRNVLS